MRILFKKYGAFCVALLLLPVALLVNLGVMTFIDDEAIRALVALEMRLSGNYITPTLHGAFYYNKPPLFNWILLVFFQLFGRFDEFSARFPTLLALLGFASTVYIVFRKHYGWQVGFFAAFALITCGRILFWDSMLALIDILFSWVVFGLFMVVFHFFSKERWGALFFWSYLLAAVGFLLKGLPAVVFQGITLLTYFAYRGQFKRLFSGVHILGGFVFIGVVGAYYAVYAQYNGLDTVFQTLFRESSKRTVATYGLGKSILHLFTFPLEMLYHFFPWSFLIFYVFDRNTLARIREDRFLEFLSVAFLANILIYWSSPGIYPRYLLMFIPLVFGVGLRLQEWHQARGTWQFRFIQGFFLVLIIVFALGIWAPLFLDRLSDIPYRTFKTIGLGIAILGVALFMAPEVKNRMLALVLILLLARIGFNWFIIPDRNTHDFGALCRASSRQVGSNYRGIPLYVYKETDVQPTNSFYLTNARGKIIPRVWDHLDKTGLYIVDPIDYPWREYTKQDSILVRHGKFVFDVGYLK